MMGTRSSKGKPRQYQVSDERVVALRRAGYSCRSVAAELDVPESHVWSVMRRTGNAGRYHDAPNRNGSSKKKKPRVDMYQRIADVLDEWGVLTIEEGAAGGYVATLNDEHTGPERQSVRAAIDAAMRTVRSER
jgi:hypothetical protein